MIRKNADVWASMISLIFAIVFFVTSLRYDYIEDLGPGAGFLPSWLSGLMIVLSIVYVVQAMKNKFKLDNFFPNKAGLKRIGVIIGSLLLFIVIVNYTGFIVACSALLFLLLLGEYRWYICASIAIGGSLLLFYIFDVLVRVPLPVNVYGW